MAHVSGRLLPPLSRQSQRRAEAPVHRGTAHASIETLSFSGPASHFHLTVSRSATTQHRSKAGVRQARKVALVLQSTPPACLPVGRYIPSSSFNMP